MQSKQTVGRLCAKSDDYRVFFVPRDTYPQGTAETLSPKGIKIVGMDGVQRLGESQKMRDSVDKTQVREGCASSCRLILGSYFVYLCDTVRWIQASSP